MENRVAKFEKVSLEQFEKDYESFRKSIGAPYTKELAKVAYDNIVLPLRATAGSSGYDFRIPFDLDWVDWETYNIPTGIRCETAPGWMLMLMPKSGLSLQHYTRFINTVGNVDSDYYGAENEGHIIVGLRMEKVGNTKGVLVKSNETFKFVAGQKIVQGVFLPHGITLDDEAKGIRVGGYGSTGL